MDLPVFDFNNPWAALIQIGLFFVLPQLVGLVTDKLTDAKVKTLLLGLLTLAATVGNFALDFAVGNHWEDFEPVALVNIIVNFAITWMLANSAYRNVLVPTGAAAAAQNSTAVKIFGPSPSRIAAETKSAPRAAKK